jgi:hypothetical protein
MTRRRLSITRQAAWWAALGGAAVGAFLAFAMPPGLFSGDEGVKLVQSLSLLESGWQSAAIPYPGSDLDPDEEHLPLQPPFIWHHAGAWYGIYSLIYTSAAALAWATAGLRGVFLLSWLGAATTLVVLAGLATRAVGPKWAVVVVVATALATPLLLYGTLNFEHTWACAAAVGCLGLLARPGSTHWAWLGAGALLGLGAAIRPELYAFAVGVVAFSLVLWGWRRDTLVRLVFIAAGAGLVSAIDLISKALLFGSFLPNLQVSDLPPTTYEVNFTRLVPPDIRGLGISLLCAALAIGLLPAIGKPSRVAKWLGGIVVILIFAFLAWQALAAVTPSMFADNRTLIGLFAATPLAVTGLLRGVGPSRSDNSGLAAACAAAAIAFVVAVVAVRIPGFIGGLELGSRYLLPAVPLLLIAGADYLRSQDQDLCRRLTVAASMPLAALSIQATCENGMSAYLIRQHTSRLLAAVESTGVEDVVTRHFWIPQLLGPLYFEKRLYLYPDEELLRRMMDKGRVRVVGVDLMVGIYSGDRVKVTRERVVLKPGHVMTYRLGPPE